MTDQVVTFDDHGVSGHPNHISLYHASMALSSSSSRPLTLLTLKSTGILRKYLGPLECLCYALLPPQDEVGNPTLLTVTNLDLPLAYRMMAAHHSQFVWYRKLFVLFSRYGYINHLSIHRSAP